MKIKIEDGKESIEFNAELFMIAFMYLEANLKNGAYKIKTTMGVVEINGEDMTLNISITPVNCICGGTIKEKNQDKCQRCGGKWSTRKKTNK